jgi:hypothetical protein
VRKNMAGQGLPMPVMDGYGRKEVLKQAEESGIEALPIGLALACFSLGLKR